MKVDDFKFLLAVKFPELFKDFVNKSCNGDGKAPMTFAQWVLSEVEEEDTNLTEWIKSKTPGLKNRQCVWLAGQIEKLAKTADEIDRKGVGAESPKNKLKNSKRPVILKIKHDGETLCPTLLVGDSKNGKVDSDCMYIKICRRKVEKRAGKLSCVNCPLSE